MLRFLGERGIVPGTRLELVERQPFDGPLFVRVGEDTHVLGATLARAMHMRQEDKA
jgi:DtxR family Mn-dependent transcriptional regulator